MSGKAFKTGMRSVLNPLVDVLAALGVTPGSITVAGLVLSAVAGLVLAAGSFLAGGIILLPAGLCDVLDGMVARVSGKGDRFGAVADSCADRYAESLVLGGLLYYYGAGEGAGVSGPALSAYLVFAALVGSYMVSYVRARAEGAGLTCDVGLMERPERLTVLVVGALLGPTVMTVLLWPLAILANATALHRLVAVRRQVKGRGEASGAESKEPGAGSPKSGPSYSPGFAPGGRPPARQVEHKGLFVTLEGVEGSGKTTQASRVAEALAARGRDVVTTREPGGTETGEAIRKLLLDSEDGSVGRETELMLYMAARSQHVEDVIWPALESGRLVLCDRFSDATVAYQAGGRGVPEETVRAVNAVATGGLEPDLTVLLDLPEEEGIGRLEGRGGGPDRMERESGSFHKSVREAYLEIARREPRRVKVVDATLSEDRITEEVVSMIEETAGRRS